MVGLSARPVHHSRFCTASAGTVSPGFDFDGDEPAAQVDQRINLAASRIAPKVDRCLAAAIGGTAYSTSKGALAALTFSLAREVAGDGVTVNGIAPAYVKTPMVTEQLTEAQRQELLEQIPVGRFCEAEEFAHVVTFLTHPLAEFITGEVVDLNGGLQFD